MLNSPAWQRQRSLYRKMYLSSDYPLCFTSYNFFCLFLWHTDMAAFSTGLTVRSEVTFIDKGLILSLLWDQRSIHVEWECEHPVLPVSSPTHPQRITVCVCDLFTDVAEHTYAKHPPFHNHMAVLFMPAHVTKHSLRWLHMFMSCSKLLWACARTSFGNYSSLLSCGIKWSSHQLF